MSTDWDAVGYVISSKYRSSVVRELADGPATPTMIADEADCSLTHVSRALSDLEERDVVQLIVPEEQRKDRLYELTADGEELWTVIQTNDLTT